MKRFASLFFAMAVIMMSASTCDKESLKMYHDSERHSVYLTGGAWGLVEVQYWTAGVFSSEKKEPESLMEFLDNGTGRTLKLLPDGSREVISTFHYEKYPGSVTLFTEKEWENNRSYTEEDSQFMRGRTYNFKVIDENTISCRETLTSGGGSYLVNIFSRF